MTDAGRFYLDYGRFEPATARSIVAALSEVDREAGSNGLAVRASRALTTRKKRPVSKTRAVQVQEVYMRYRVLVTRVQVAERWVRASDEENAAAKVQAEFDKPYGYLGSWKTTTSEVEVVEAEQVAGISSNPLSPDGPLLLSMKDAARALGISYGMLYELTNRGDIERISIGSRRYISREALLRFIDEHTHRGYNR
ncbi:hypothetical protein GCM10027572_07690 [Flexivirga lutea]